MAEDGGEMVSLSGFGDWLKSGLKLPWGEGAKQAIEAAKATAELGKAWQEAAPKLESLKNLERVETFFKAFDSPIGKLAVGALPFASVGIDLLKLYLAVTKTPPTLEQSVALAAQLGYLESLQQTVDALTDETLLAPLKSVKLIEVFERQLKRLEKVDLSFVEATSTLTDFPRCALSQSLNEVLLALLIEQGIPQSEADRLVEQVSWGTPQYFHVSVALLEGEVTQLRQYFSSGGQAVQGQYASIERYLQQCIDPLPQETVFDETGLTFDNLYVPLSVQRLDAEGKREIGSPVKITDWVQAGLAQQQMRDRDVLFVQGEAGRGKSVFCRMFASWVRRRFRSAWVPILIRLRDVHEIKDNLSETLKNQLENEDFVQSDTGWLTDPNVRFLLIFDGFDELLLEGREGGGLKDFLQQVAKFQEGCQHQCLITGRPLALQGIDKQLTRIGNLQRVRLNPMTDAQREQWLVQWGEQFGAQEASAFCDFLTACPDDISHVLAREPLLLYLLGRLHREEKETFNAQMFEGAEGIRAKVQVYERSILWVLGKQRQNENIRLSGLEMEDLREVLQEAALCVMQSGNETAKLSMLRGRFVEANSPAAVLFEAAQKETQQDEDKTLNNLLTTFYLQPGKGDKAGSVEFAHKSFGEFLFAERLHVAFDAWTEVDRRRRLRMGDAEVARQVYDLLGYGALTAEVVEYLKEKLFPSGAAVDALLPLFNRLKQFYEDWCEGFFIDSEPSKNWPQLKMMQLKAAEIDSGLRQVDIHAGLNVLLLLFVLHGYGRQQVKEGETSPLHFHPCGGSSSGTMDRQKLNRMIGYAQLIQLDYLAALVGRYLIYADLIYADLSDANLRSANLIYAALSDANLRSANLRSANLIYADLRSANLSDANLIYADLRSANLSDADLRSANLIYADLSSANLSDANLSSANLSNADLISADLSDTNLRSANLSDANLSSANLISVNLRSANLISADLSDTNLSDANLSDANLRSADLSDTNLRSANLSNADLSYADLRSANLSDANLSDANLIYANLRYANLIYANLISADLSDTNLRSANLRSANLSDANLSDANLSDIRFNEETTWEGVRGLETARNVPEALKQQLGLT